MSLPRRVTICIACDGPLTNGIRQCVSCLIEHTPLAEIELRVGFSAENHSFFHVLGMLCPDRVVPECRRLPQGLERFQWVGRDNLPILAWSFPDGRSNEMLARAVFHDVPLATNYVVQLEVDAVLESGWWESLLPLMDQGLDYIGQPAWHEYSPSQQEALQSFPWFMGVPFDRKDGRVGVSYMRPGFVVVKAEGLQQADYPEAGGQKRKERLGMFRNEVLLGEIARQLGWTHATHCQHVSLPPQAQDLAASLV
jgi:hypothetical protein